MKVFCNIALLLLFSVSTTSFAGIENLRILTEELCDDEDMHAAADAFREEEYVETIKRPVHTVKKEKQSVNLFKVGAGILSGKWAFAYREIMGNKSNPSSKKHEKYVVEYRKVSTNKLEVYQDFYTEQFNIIEKILREYPSETQQLEQIKKLPEKQIMLLIELASCISRDPSFFNGISLDDAQLLLDIIAKKIINPLLESLYNVENTYGESYMTLDLIIDEYSNPAWCLGSFEEYIQNLVSACIMYNNYPVLK